MSIQDQENNNDKNNNTNHERNHNMQSIKDDPEATAATAATTTGTNNNNNISSNLALSVTRSQVQPPKQQPRTDDTEQDNNDNNNSKPSCRSRLVSFYWDNEFLILVVCAILLARAYPPLGADYLQPEITATWLAVCFIFLMAGLGLQTAEFAKALQQLKFNCVVQVFNFGVASASVYGLSRALQAANILSQDLADGMVVCASLPMTINMVLVLTKASGGNEAAAIFNAAFGNLLGVFLSPVLILGYLGVKGDINLLDVFVKLALRVVLPTVLGQILQKTSHQVVAFVKQHQKRFKAAQQYCLVFIVYTVFCRTFEDDSTSSVGDIFLMIVFQFLSLVALMVAAWTMLRFLFPHDPKLRVMGLYGCTHKTVAMGVPLIDAIYAGNPAVGLYTLPLLIWHPMQLVIGTFLAPRLAKFVEQEEERLGLVSAADNNDENDEGNEPNEQKDQNEIDDTFEATEEGRISPTKQ